jgi:hypothetical protein
MALPPLGPPTGGGMTPDGLPIPGPGEPFYAGPAPEPEPLLAEAPPGPVVSRETPEPEPRRKHLVDAWTDMVKQAKNKWEPVFRKMDQDMRFASGYQWPEDPKVSIYNDVVDDDLYVANITLQHIQKKVANTYAKDPKAVCRRRPKLLATVWDGTTESLMQAQATLQTAMALMTGQPMPGAPQPPAGGGPGVPNGQPPMSSGDGGSSPGAPGAGAMAPMPPMPGMEDLMNAQAVLEDAQNVKQQLALLNKIARTLEILYAYELSEQQQPFKSMMKMTVRRAATSGVGWTRLGFQRLMGRSPDLDSRVADVQSRLDLVERISADLADDEARPDDATAEQLRLLLQDMATEQDVVLREGLMFTWPKSTAIIPDPKTTQLRDFLGADWVAEEFCLTPNEVKETYKVDVSKNYRSYDRMDTGTDYERARQTWENAVNGATDDANIDSGDAGNCIVWEIFNKKDGLIYVICDGYPDFLREPARPDVYTDRFWPWFLTAFNEQPGVVFPVSDVSLMRPMQRELNRSRQGLREHRVASRPKTVYASGVLSEEDIEAFKNHPVNAMIAVNGLQPGQDINTVIQQLKGVPIDPNLYEVNPVYQDLLRTMGDTEADFGGTGGDTATESSMAANSKASAVGSNVDDLDETLTQIAKAGGQILLLNVAEDTVKEIVGPGAVWPTLTKAEVARDLYMEIQAGSSGRPNQAQELQNYERIAPILMQIGGIKPTFLAKEGIKRLDDRIDVDEAIADGLPSITQMNSGKLPGQGAEPGMQGPEGANNGPQPPSPNPSAPAPQPAQPQPPSPNPTTRLQ